MSAEKFLAKARRSLDAVKLLFEHVFYDEAGSRACYATFDAARAALIETKAPVDAEIGRTHAGLIGAFGLHIVQQGLVPRDIGRTLGQAQQVRLVADYKGDPIEREDAERIIALAARFIESVATMTPSRPALEAPQ